MLAENGDNVIAFFLSWGLMFLVAYIIGFAIIGWKSGRR